MGWLSWSQPCHDFDHNLQRNRGGANKTKPETDLTRWRLKCEDGRQTWHYIPESQELTREQTLLEKHAIGLNTVEKIPELLRPKTVKEALENGLSFYTSLQAEDGHWAGDYGGPLFLMPGLVIVCYITNSPFTNEQKAEMIRYLRSVQCHSGGWGLHIEGPPTVFGCALNYVCLRLLGVPADDKDLVRALHVLHKLGGTLSIPSWGKFWLAVLNVYNWTGLHNLFPEMWLLPEWLPIHPSKMWCHCRQVYLGMSYCYGARISGPETKLVLELRKELYSTPYDLIDWSAHRNNVSPADIYASHSWLLDLCYVFLDIYETYHVSSWRQHALSKIYDHICADDDFTKCISIGPVSKTIQMLVRWHVEGPSHPKVVEHRERIADYLWLGLDGMKMTGTNGSQLWDTAFAVQALTECGAGENDKYSGVLKCAHTWLLNAQVKKNPDKYKNIYRHQNKGGWPFSTLDCGWIVGDCTAEALKAVMSLEHSSSLIVPIDTQRLYDAVDLLLSLRNSDGGFATYETKRGGSMLELLNPAEVFGDIMIDYTYVETTSAIMQGLKYFTKYHPHYREKEIRSCLSDGLKYIIKQQRKDGSWFGSWGVCFTYGCWFALEAFACMGHRYDVRNTDGPLENACAWLVDHRLSDGGWGENFESCEQKQYVAAEQSQIVNTAWALLALMAVGYPDSKVLDSGIKLLMDRQLSNGDFPQENTAGVFNLSCAIHYDNYRNVFPLWALGRYQRLH